MRSRVTGSVRTERKCTYECGSWSPTRRTAAPGTGTLWRRRSVDEKDNVRLKALSNRIRDFWLWILVVALGTVVFFQTPGGYSSTSHALLHGLCAQTPSHTFTFNGERLPFDARMTGIYGGLLITVAVLAIRRRLFCSGDVSRPVVTALGGLVVAMGIDGFNSLLTDLMIGQLYQPGNVARLITGYGAGIALAVALSWLVSASAWRMSRPVPPMSGASDLAASLAGLALYAVTVLFGPGWLHGPLTMFLVFSAWLTMTMLMLVLVMLVFRIEDQIRSAAALHVPVAIAALLGICAMLVLAGGRFWLERTLGISNAMM